MLVGAYPVGSVPVSATDQSQLIRTQTAYRWRNDDGSEATATWKAAEDVNINLPLAVAGRLRIQVDVYGDPPSTALKLQFRKVGDPYWEDVGNP